MQHVDLMIHAAWIIPVESDGRIHSDHSIVVKGDCIEAILPTQQAKLTYQASKELSLNDHLLFPGLINAHCHSAMNLMKGLADDLPLMDWLHQHIWPTESRWIDSEFIEDGTELAAAEMLLSGTTCVNDMYFFPESAAQSYSKIGIRANVGLIVVDFPTRWCV